ncbi:MAG: hypothetical protein FJZ00_11205, partial [Candidatus Sericytochromatia bacterium]|nr:hypothetical protein [Candidatus Tanganyikabacteria bacterium]
ALALEADREVNQKEVDEILATQAEVRDRLERLRARHTELYNKRGMLDVERYKLEAQRREADDRLVRLKEERVGQLAQVKDAEAEAKRQGEAAEKARMTVETAREDEGRCLANVETLRKSLSDVEAALTDAKGQFAVAEQQLKAQEATMGTAVDAVLDAGLPGVIGTLLMLGEAEPEFARALQEAAGPRLRNIVVENDGVAAKVSKLLHGKAVGRVTCLPLNKLQPPRRLNQVKQPGCLGYAIDKVRFDAKYEAAFFQAFGDTLLFETLDHARPHIGQYRMVTLDGDVLDKGGAMTVGRSRGEPAHFLANLRTAYEERKAAVQTTAQRVSQRQHALAEMQKGAESAMTRLREAQHAAMAADLEQEAALARAKDAAARLAETDTAIGETEREVVDRERAVEAAIDSGLPVDAEFNEVEFELAEVEESVGNDRLNELMEQVRNAGWDADQARSRANGLATEIDAAERSRQEADLALVTAEAERARKLAQAERENADAERIEADLTRLQQDRLTLEAEHQRAKSGLEELAALRDAAKDRRFVAERALEARNQDLERLSDGLRHTTEKLEEQTRKLQETETGLWEDGIEPPEGRPEMTTAQAEAARQDAQVRLEALGMVNQLA